MFKSIKNSAILDCGGFTPFKYQLIIFANAFGFSLVANIINIDVTHLMYGSADNILYGSTLGSPDNNWYLNQIKNYLNGLGFTIDPLDPIYAVRRTPGYPLFYGLHYIIFGEAGAHKVIPYTQTFLHGMAAVYLFKTAKLLFTNPRVAVWAGVLYGLSPLVASYLFMTMTEAVFPAMIIFVMYLIISSYEEKSMQRSLYAGIVMAAVVLVRPMTGLTLLFVIPVAFYYGNLKSIKKIKINIIFVVSFVITMLPWTIRNYLVFDKFVPLETYYLNGSFEDQNLKNVALYRWWSAWGSPEGLRLHGAMGVDIYSNEPYRSIDAFINNEVPLWVYNVESKSHARMLLIDYQKCMLRSIELNGGRRLRYRESPDMCEYKVSAGFDAFTDKIRSQYPFQAFVVSPFYKRGKEYMFHSAIHTWRSFDDYRNHPVKMVLKGLAYIINIFLWLFSIAYLISPRSVSERIALGIVPLASFIFIVYYSHVEGRYLIGIYPFLYLMSTVFLSESLIPSFRKVCRTKSLRDNQLI